MEIKDWITIISVVAVIIGWFINGTLNRRNEIAKKRFEYRMKALQSFLDIHFFIQKNSEPFSNSKFLPMLEDARKNFQLYGEDDEILLFEAFIKAIEARDLEKANSSLNKLVPLVRTKVRKELNI